MARYIANGNTAFGTAGTWDTVTNTPTLHATTNITISTSNLYTAAFTAPGLANTCTGCAVNVVAKGTGGAITVILQEYNGAAWADVVGGSTSIINTTDLQIANWIYFDFATPYTFATVTASYYRFRIVNAGAAGTTTFATDSGGANCAYMATDDRHSVPTTSDDVFILGSNATTSITVTGDGTQSLGSGTSTTGFTGNPLTNARSFTHALHICYNGFFAADTAASATFTVKGNTMVMNGGSFTVGTSVTAYPAARVFTYHTDENGTTVKYCFAVRTG
jgi:hypothetical protein